MRDAADADIDSLLRAAARRLRVERGRAVLARAGLVLLACLPLLLLWHFVVAPVPVMALAVLAALAPLAALAAAAGSVTRREAAEWIDRRLDGGSTFGTLLEYAHDPRPAAARLRSSARTRAADCAARLARLPCERSLTRPLSWTSLALLVAGAVLSLTDGRHAPRGVTPPVAQQSTAAGATRPGPETADVAVVAKRDPEGQSGDATGAATAGLSAGAAHTNAATEVVVEESAPGSLGRAPGAGDSASGTEQGRDAGSGLDRGGVNPAAPSDAQLAVELRKLLGEPTALDQRARQDVEGRYTGGAAVAKVAEGAPGHAVAAALAPRTLEQTSLDPATAAFLRAYSDAGSR